MNKSLDFLEEELICARLKNLISDVIFGPDSIIVILNPSKNVKITLSNLKNFIENNFDEVKYTSVTIDDKVSLYSIEIFHSINYNLRP